MHHSPDQLESLWQALKAPGTAAHHELLQRYSGGSMPRTAPRIACDDAHAQVLSIPRPDHPGWHVYARVPGGGWVELA